MQQRGAPRDRSVGAELVSEHGRDVGALDAVGEHVLAVAGAEFEPSEHLRQFLMERRDAGVLGRSPTHFEDVLLHFGLRLPDDFLDARGMNAPVENQFVERQPRRLPAHIVER